MGSPAIVPYAPRRDASPPRLFSLAVLAAGFVACGEEGIHLAKSDPNYEGAKIFGSAARAATRSA